MPSITPFLWFDTQAEEAMNFYASIFKRSKVTFVNRVQGKVMSVAFELEGVHPHDVAQLLDSRGVAVRAGHHCAKPAHKRYGVQSSTRASSYLYNTEAEIDALLDGIEHVKKFWA